MTRVLAESLLWLLGAALVTFNHLIRRAEDVGRMSKRTHNLSAYQQRRHEERMQEQRHEQERERRLRKQRASPNIFEQSLADEPNEQEDKT